MVKPVDAEDFANEKIRTLDLPLETNIVTSTLETRNQSAETYGSNPEVIITKTTDPNIKSEPELRKYCNYCHKSNHYVSNCFRKRKK